MSFAKLKKNRKNATDKLQQAAQSIKDGKGGFEDESEWKPTVDKAGNGYAVIRFLPAAEGADLPWVKWFEHTFKGPNGKWFWEKCPTTIGGQCPVCAANSQLWNSGIESDKEIARDRKRRLHYTANILVISDSNNPESEGKVFRYTFGQKIFDKITELMTPEFEDETPVNPFDFWEGANFKLKIRQVAGYRNYDKSEFDAPSELFDGDDAKLEAVYEQLHNLQEIVDPSTFKTTAELQKKYNSVIGEAEVLNSMDGDDLADVTTTARSKASKVEEEEDLPMEFGSSESDEDDVSYFAKLAQED